MCRQVTIDLTVSTRPPCGELGSAASAATPSATPPKSLMSFHEANPPWRRGWPLPHPAQHEKPASSCPLAGMFTARQAVFIETTDTANLNLLKLFLTGSCRRCRFRTVQHCWGRTVTSGRWRGHSSLLWWTPQETAYLRKINKIKSHITFEVRNKIIGIKYIVSKSSAFIYSPTGGSVVSTCSSQPFIWFDLFFPLSGCLSQTWAAFQWLSNQLFLI